MHVNREMMQIQTADPLQQATDFDLISRYLPTDQSCLLELGCGAAFTTRRLAENLPIQRLVAMEVDRIQHEKNLQIDDLPNVEFVVGGAQAIQLPNDSVDGVIMLKSLHHVPVDRMDDALDEIARVLKPGGLAYLSEPVYAGRFNEILKLFNDEKTVRQAAFDAVVRAVGRGSLELVEEIHFASESRFSGFAEFEQRILGATHSEFAIDETLFARIHDRFAACTESDGSAVFHNPMRADILRKPV
jgi:ubiquinone/menaquinone biosynthesis C-methylase UbiE